MSKNLNNAFANLFTPDAQMKALGSVTKIRVQLKSGGFVMIPNVPNGSIESELLKHKVGRSSIHSFKRVQVAAR